MEIQIFDYIVVGAGSAGAVLANRLSADPMFRVLVLEAGRESHPWSQIPVGFAKLIENPAANWLYASEPDASTGFRRIQPVGGWIFDQFGEADRDAGPRVAFPPDF